MKEALIVAIVFGSFVLIPAVIGGTILMSIKLLKGGTTRKAASRGVQNIPGNLSGALPYGKTCGGAGNHPVGPEQKGS